MNRLHMPDDQTDKPTGRFPVLDIPEEVLRPIAERADLELLEDSGEWSAATPGYQGAWAVGSTPEEAREELISVLREWLSAGAFYHRGVPDEVAGAVAAARAV